MNLLEEYKISNRKALRNYRLTQLVGWVPVGLSAALLLSKGVQAGPGLWCALGLGVAGQMILRGAYQIHLVKGHRSALAEKLVLHTDAWFPYFIMMMQTSFIALTLVIFWFTICELGFQASFFQHALVILLIILAPFRRVLKVQQPEEMSTRMVTLRELLAYVNISLITLLVAGCLSILLVPPDEPSPSEMAPGMIFIWVPAILVVLVCFVLFIDHVYRRRPVAGPTTSKPTDIFE